MTDTSPTDDRPTHYRQAAAILFVVTMALLGTISGLAVAQDLGNTWEDDFEDGNVDGWQGENMNVSEESIEGQYSLHATDGISSQADNPEWVDGPVLDLQEEFSAEGTSRIDQGDGTHRSGFGIVRPSGEDDSAEGVILIFSGEYGVTFIGTNNEENPEDLETIDDTFNNEWVNWEIYSSGDGTMQAKVWSVGESEPGTYQISRDIGQDSGEFSAFIGTVDANRELWLDSVTIEGQQVEGDPHLSIDTSSLLLHGDTQPYTVERTVYDEDLQKNVTRDVTDDADVESLNPEGLTVNEGNHTLTATSDEEFQDRVTVQAEEGGNLTYTEVTVADKTMDNIEILPPEYRYTTTLDSGTFQAILISVFAGIVGTRWSTAFGGLGMMQLVLVAGWFGGYVSTGIALVGLFTAMFIGLNLAANIDYTVRR